MIRKLSATVLSLGLVGLSFGARAPLSAAKVQVIQAPVLKWQHGGCFDSWCETGWYSSPAVADLDGDGDVEVIASAYSIIVLDGETGSLQWRVASGHDRSEVDATNVGRTWPGIVVADIDADGKPEVATAHSGGYVSVYDHQGYFQSGWPQRPTLNELRGLSAFDLDADGSMEIVVTGAVSSKTNTWVFEHDGTLRPGWPRLVDESGYAWGVFNDNAAVGDLDGDGLGEIVVPSDVHYICAYEADGIQIPANGADYGDKGWGKVGVWESLDIELRGWGTCDAEDERSERYRANFAHGPAALGDLNADGLVEVVAVGNVYDCIPGYPSKYNGPFLFNADRSRLNIGSDDWRVTPIDTGAPLSEDWNVIENNQPNPVVADLDGDGRREMLFASYDGRVHAFWLDKTEHGTWPYSVYSAGEGIYRFGSEPVVVDLNADGKAEVIFASWVEKGTGLTGKLHILDFLGAVLHEVDLPPAFGGLSWNGALAAPTLANIDADSDLEVVLNTAHAGLVAYDLPNTGQANILWGTGRGNQLRTGSNLHGTLQGSTKRVWPTLPDPGDVVTYTIRLQNPGPTLPTVWVSDTLPAELYSLGNLWASAGSYGEGVDFRGHTVIYWTGSVGPSEPVTITYGVTVSADIIEPQALVNWALIDDGEGASWIRTANITVMGRAFYLPVIQLRGD